MSGPQDRCSSCSRVRAVLVACALTMSAQGHAQAPSAAEAYAEAVRLLEQSTFGPTDTLIGHVLQVGTQAFLDEQYAVPASRYPILKYVPAGQQATFCPTDPDPQCGRDYYTLFLLQSAFFTSALNGPDQLRQRVAFALSQILVTSGLTVHTAYGMSRYQQIFLDNAFGNYEQILTRVTLSPVMGEYLNMVNNDQPTASVQPNENYARELLQLFTIGVWQLNPDGTQKVDAAKAPIPAYGQDEVEGFAHVFTGWTYPVLPGTPARTHNPKNYLGDMVPVDSNHDKGTKLLLNGVTLPAGGEIQADLAAAIHNVFMHPNVGSFVGKQLIQKLVTGDPTPEYVSRVAAAFDNNGHGVRGDMKAVVNAILIDPEARGYVKNEPGYGKLREPVLYVAAAARMLGTQSDGVYLAQQAGQLGQPLFYSASVFNYYPPDLSPARHNTTCARSSRSRTRARPSTATTSATACHSVPSLRYRRSRRHRHDAELDHADVARERSRRPARLPERADDARHDVDGDARCDH